MANSWPSSNPQLFHCPTCGASLPHPGDVPSVRCEYCGSTVLVPAEYRSKKQPEGGEFGRPVVINIGNQAADYDGASVRAGRSLATIIGILVTACVGLGILSAVLASAGVFSAFSFMNETVNQAINQAEVTVPAQIAIPTQLSALLPTGEPTTAAFYQLALSFGTKGSGPGQFDDARSLAIDSDSNLFVAEYQDGRVQKFDPSGKFVQLISIPPDDQGYMTISDIAADFAGHIYIVRRGSILIFNTADGSPAGTIPASFPDTWYETLVVDGGDNLYALHTSAGELDLIKMDATGNQAYRKVQVTQDLVKQTEISTVRKLAVDGLGNLYLLDTSQNQVYKFDPQGKFIDRFGSAGDGPGLLENPEDLAVDGQGRIYILNQDGIEIFDNNGVGLKLLPREYTGWAFDIKLDLAGSVVIITNAPQVYRYTVDLEE